MARDTESGKCRHCNGWAFEPAVYPMAVCTACKGSGRRTAPTTDKIAALS